MWNDVNDVLVFLLLTLNLFLSFSSVFIADFEQVNVSLEDPNYRINFNNLLELIW